MTGGTYPKYKDEPDTNRLAVNGANPHLSLELRKLSRITAVPTADFDLVPITDHVSTEIAQVMAILGINQNTLQRQLSF